MGSNHQLKVMKAFWFPENPLTPPDGIGFLGFQSHPKREGF